jgi:hypothetical protein
MTDMYQKLNPYWLYFPAFGVVILGLIVYFWHKARTFSVFINIHYS